jgi:hypothetical protein
MAAGKSTASIDGNDRASVYRALGSFDHTGMDDDTFARQALGLLDNRVTEIARTREIIETGDVGRALGSLANHFATRTQPQCRVYEDRRISTGAEAVLDHTFTFYGETHSLGSDIDWEHNPGTDHWGHDLNRFTYLSNLVESYESTGDRRFGRKAIELILDWIAKTDVCDAFIPKKSPYVWGSYLNINGHLVEWASALAKLLPAGLVAPRELIRILKSVHDQLAYLEIVIPTHTNNWIIFGARGMLITALFFPELASSDRFIGYAWDRFAEEIDRQILPDGVQFELTQHYHYGVARSYATANYLTMRSGRAVPERPLRAVDAMCRYLEQTVTPDGLHLSFNDSDADCGHEVLAFLAAPETAEARGGNPGRIGASGDLSRLEPEYFPYGGVAFLRDRDHYLAFDGGPFGASHQHEDSLSFWLSAFGRTLIVDPGRYLYDRTTPFRPYLLSTAAHNTITVDGLGQRSREHRESWVARTPLENLFETTETRVSAGASYIYGYGYGEAVPVVHRRSVIFERGRFYLLFDLLEGEGEHDFTLRFQFMPGGAERCDSPGPTVRTTGDDVNVVVIPECAVPLEPSIHVGETDPIAGWYSIGYHRLAPAPQAIFRGRAAFPIEVATLLYPFRGTQTPDVGIERTGSSGYRVRTPEGDYHYTRDDLARFGTADGRVKE